MRAFVQDRYGSAEVLQAREVDKPQIGDGEVLVRVRAASSLGADEVIDYTTTDFTQAGRHYDFILDNVSNHSLSRLRRALTASGTLVPNGGRFDKRWLASGGRIVQGMLLFRFSSQKFGNFLLSPNQADLAVLKELIEAGKVTPVIDRTYPLDETAKAMGHVGEGHARGKTTITVPQLATATAG